MEIFEKNGIVLRRRPYGDTGIIFRVLFPEQGIVSFLAKGARTSKSNIYAVCEPTNLIRISWMKRETRDLYIPKRVVLCEEFIDSKENYTVFTEIASILKDVERFLPVNSSSKRIYDSLLLLFRGLEAGRDVLSGKLWFYRELLQEAGGLPDFTHCSKCGMEDDLHILNSGAVICGNCQQADDSIVESDRRILKLLRSHKIEGETNLLLKTIDLLMRYRDRLI